MRRACKVFSMSWVEQKGVRLTTTEALIAILGYIGFFTVKRIEKHYIISLNEKSIMSMSRINPFHAYVQ